MTNIDKLVKSFCNSFIPSFLEDLCTFYITYSLNTFMSTSSVYLIIDASISVWVLMVSFSIFLCWLIASSVCYSNLSMRFACLAVWITNLSISFGQWVCCWLCWFKSLSYICSEALHVKEVAEWLLSLMVLFSMILTGELPPLVAVSSREWVFEVEYLLVAFLEVYAPYHSLTSVLLEVAKTLQLWCRRL